MPGQEFLERIREALFAAKEALTPFTQGEVSFGYKEGMEPVTKADMVVDGVLKKTLLRGAEGWLSEETADDPSRLEKRLVWVVDPLDGTREFVEGIPEWCVSIGLVEAGEAVAGGILNPTTDQLVLGMKGAGLTLNGKPAGVRDIDSLEGIEVLASNSEMKRGEWERFGNEPFSVKSMGSVAYKLSLVACGLADLTWTPQPKREWDIAAGVALLKAGGGEALLQDGSRPRFNKKVPRVPNLLGAPRAIAFEVLKRWFGNHHVRDCYA